MYNKNCRNANECLEQRQKGDIKINKSKTNYNNIPV